MTHRRILVVEDDRDIARLLSLHLSELARQVDVYHDGLSAMTRLQEGRYDLVILDLTLPGLDGLSVCERIRQQPHYTSILMLTARSSEADRVLGLELGADDYLVKPFSLRELLARVKATFRRSAALRDTDERTPLHVGALAIDVAKRKVMLGGDEVLLTAKEFDLLWQFAQHPGRVYTRTQLLDLVWGSAFSGFEHTVNSHINRLRSKLERDPAKPDYILTVWGVGYKFAESA